MEKQLVGVSSQAPNRQSEEVQLWHLFFFDVVYCMNEDDCAYRTSFSKILTTNVFYICYICLDKTDGTN
jgi:hypothetical protein